MLIRQSNIVENESLCKNEQNLVFTVDDFSSASAGMKVEVMAISGPVLLDSGDKHISNLNLQIINYSKKKYSLISHNNLTISKTLHLSRLITRLQI
jgi:hypothetical protein